MNGRLLLHPEGLYLLLRTILRHGLVVGGFRLPSEHHCQEADLPGEYPRRFKLSISPRLEALACFVHRVGRKHDSDMDFSRFITACPFHI